MKSYLILTSPGASAADEDARFIRDGFSWAAFLFPAVWLLVHRVWLSGVAVVALQLAASALLAAPGLALAGLALQIAVSVIVALEGPALAAAALARRDWTMRGVTTADDLGEAEEVYFSLTEEETPVTRKTASPRYPARQTPAFGLIGYDGDR